MLVCTFGIFSQKLFHPLAHSFFFSLSLSLFGSQNCLSPARWTTPTFTLNVCANFFSTFFCVASFFLLMNKIFSFWEKLKKKTRQENMNNFQTNFMRISREFHMSCLAFYRLRWVWERGQFGEFLTTGQGCRLFDNSTQLATMCGIINWKMRALKKME